MNTLNCLQCGEKLLPMVSNGKMVQYTMNIVGNDRNTTPPPVTMWVCKKCGHVSLFVLAFRDGGRQININDVPEHVKRNFQYR